MTLESNIISISHSLVGFSKVYTTPSFTEDPAILKTALLPLSRENVGAQGKQAPLDTQTPAWILGFLEGFWSL